MLKKNKLKIGMVLDKKLPDTRVENEAAILSKAGFEVILLALDFSGRKSRFENRNDYKVYWLPFKKWIVDKLRPFAGTKIDIYSMIWKRLIKKYIKQEMIDILHLHDLYMGLSAESIHIPFIVDLHENYPATVVTYSWSHKFPLNLILSHSMWKKKERKILTQANGIIVLSTDYADKLDSEYKEFDLRNKFCIYPNVPDISYLSELKTDLEIYNLEEKFTIFYYGVIGERRGIFECFDAIELIQDKIPDLHFLIVGPLDNADKRKFELKRKQFNKIITYIPWVDFKDFGSLIKNTDIAISPILKNEQHESGVANKVFQYMYFRKPLIVSNCLPQQKIIEKYDCGYIYNSGNHKNLAEVILRSYKERYLFNEMGNRAYGAVLKEFNTKIVGHNLVEFYKNIHIWETKSNE